MSSFPHSPHPIALPPIRRFDANNYGAAQVGSTIGGLATPGRVCDLAADVVQRDPVPIAAGIQRESLALPRTLLPAPRALNGAEIGDGMVKASGGLDGVLDARGDRAETGAKYREKDPRQLVGTRKDEAEKGKIQALQPALPETIMLRKGTPDSLAATTPSPSSSSSTIEPAPAFKPEFQFVVNEDAKQARKTVRKHVMKEYRRRERWEHGEKTATSSGKVVKTKQAKPEAQTAPRSDAGSSSGTSSGIEWPWMAEGEERSEKRSKFISVVLNSNKRRCVSPGYERGDHNLPTPPNGYDSSHHADPRAVVARSHIDPFSAKLNFDCGPATQAILHHFAYVMPSIMDEMVAGTNFNRLGWLYSCVAVHDPTPLHTVLGFTLAHIAQCRGLKEPPLAIEHKHKAVQLMNERMSDPEKAMSNETIGGIVNLAAYELVDSNPQRFALHMTGLFQLIRKRGGMATLRHNIGLEEVVVRLDVLRAYITLSNPRYPSCAVIRNLQPLAIKIPPSANGWNPHDFSIDDRIHVYQFCEDSIYFVHALEDLMLLIGSAAREKTEDLNPALRALILSATKQLLLDRQALGSSSAAQFLAWKCLRLAALIFLDFAMRELFDSPLTSGRFVRELKSKLLGIETPWGRSLEMLVMVLIKHDRMALEKAWRAWYIADAITVTMNSGRETWSAAEAKMLEYIRCYAMEAVPGPRSSMMWNMRAMAELVINEWE